MLINGCKNDVKLSYTAISLAKKLNLLDILCKKCLSYEEYSGIGNIIKGLCDEKITLDTLKSVAFEEITENYIKRFEEYRSNIENYGVLIEIMTSIFRIVCMDVVTEKELRILDNVMEIIESKDSLELYRKSIDSNENFKYVLDILSFDSDINLYSEVFEKFKQNPFKYCFCVEYLLKNDIFKSRTVKKIENSIDFEKYYAEPQSIVGINNEYCMNLVEILQDLREHPFLSNDFIVAGLKSKYMWTIYSSIKPIKCWSEITGKTI